MVLRVCLPVPVQARDSKYSDNMILIVKIVQASTNLVAYIVVLMITVSRKHTGTRLDAIHEAD